MTYGNSLYGQLLYGATAGGSVSPEASKPNLMDYLPPYWLHIRDMVELQDTLSEELSIGLSASDDLFQQAYLSTATWGLDAWEQEFGLATDPSMSHEWRREILQSQIRGHGTVTKQKLVDAASTFSGGEVDIVEYPNESRFVVKFVGFLGIPPNMPGFISMLEKIKPAHLSYTFEYTFTSWDMLSGMTWLDAGQRTWNQMKTYGGA